MSRNIIVHLFNWNLKDIIPQLQKVKECGYTGVQISPIQYCKEGDEWWKLYQPYGFTIGNKLGTKEDLRELCTKANEIGLKIICDIIPNHVAGSDTGAITPHEKVDPAIANNKDWFKIPECITDWDDRYTVINWSCGLPSLKLEKHEIQDIVINFMNELIDCGVRGFRIDSAKNIRLRCEGSDFFERVFNSLHHKDEIFSYGEVIFSDKELIEEYAKEINVLTNSYDGVADKSKIVTFFMSHDSELHFKATNKMTDDLIVEEWEILLSANRKSHMIFYARPYSDLWKDERIKNINWGLK